MHNGLSDALHCLQGAAVIRNLEQGCAAFVVVAVPGEPCVSVQGNAHRMRTTIVSARRSAISRRSSHVGTMGFLILASRSFARRPSHISFLSSAAGPGRVCIPARSSSLPPHLASGQDCRGSWRPCMSAELPSVCYIRLHCAADCGTEARTCFIKYPSSASAFDERLTAARPSWRDAAVSLPVA